MSITDSIEIAVSPDIAFATVSDLPQMGRYSPENTGGTWSNKATGPAKGAKFKGTNAHEKTTWSTTATVTTSEKPSCFAFSVGFAFFPIADWEFRFEATPAGCRVSETWTDRRASLFKRFIKIKEVPDRDAYTVTSIRTTLENLKASLEATAS